MREVRFKVFKKAWFYDEQTVGALLVSSDSAPFKILGFLSTCSLDASVLQNGDLIVGGPGSFYWQGMFVSEEKHVCRY